MLTSGENWKLKGLKLKTFQAEHFQLESCLVAKTIVKQKKDKIIKYKDKEIKWRAGPQLCHAQQSFSQLPSCPGMDLVCPTQKLYSMFQVCSNSTPDCTLLLLKLLSPLLW